MDTNEIADAIRPFVDTRRMAGAAMLIWRDGKAKTVCVGWKGAEAREPIQRDTIFRIASMSKPITSLAALMLIEEGRWALDDPIARWAPEFSQMRVLRTPDAPLEDTDAAERQITIEDLLTHRAGFTYGDFHTGPITSAYRDALGGDIDSDVSPDDWIAGLAALPLIDQPGRTFHYSHSTDLLGLLIARIEDRPLDEILKRRIFHPLGMVDTHFCVPQKDRPRRAQLCGFDETGQLIPLKTVPGGHTLPERPETMSYVSGGQGLWSTLDDYLRFARLFVEQGAVGGTRLLRPETLKAMTSNRLTPAQRANSDMLGMPIFAAGHGFGLGVAVVTEPEQADPMRCGGGAGSVGWPGAYGSWWQADPNDGSVLIFLAHNMVDLPQLASGIGLGVWEAIARFQAIGSSKHSETASITSELEAQDPASQRSTYSRQPSP